MTIQLSILVSLSVSVNLSYYSMAIWAAKLIASKSIELKIETK